MERAHALLGNDVIIGVLLQFRNKLGPIGRKRKLGRTAMSHPVWATSACRLSAIGTRAVESMVEFIGLSVAPSASGALNLKPKGAGLRLSLSLLVTFPPGA